MTLRVPRPEELTPGQPVKYLMKIGDRDKPMMWANAECSVFRVGKNRVEIKIETPESTLYRFVKASSLRVREGA